MTIPDLSTVVGYLKNLRDIQKTVETNAVKFEMGKIIDELYSSAFDSHTKLMEAAEEIRALKRQVEAFENWEEEKKRYALVEPRKGLFLYRLRAEAAGTEPIHDLCVNCYIRGVKSILLRPKSGSSTMVCNTCKFEGSSPDPIHSSEIDIGAVGPPPVFSRTLLA